MCKISSLKGKLLLDEYLNLIAGFAHHTVQTRRILRESIDPDDPWCDYKWDMCLTLDRLAELCFDTQELVVDQTEKDIWP